MSIQAVAWVLDNSKATLGARLALISIASHADKEGKNSCPGFGTIAEDACLTRRAAVSAVQKLVAEEHIKITCQHPRYGTNIYEILGMAGSEVTTPLGSEVTTPPSEGGGVVDDISLLPIRRKTYIGPEKARKSRIPLDFKPNETAEAIAKELGVDITAQLVIFRDHHNSKGTTFLDHQAAFRNWLRRAPTFGSPQGLAPERPRPQPGPVETYPELTEEQMAQNRKRLQDMMQPLLRKDV